MMEITVSCLWCREVLLRIAEDYRGGSVERRNCSHYIWLPEDSLERLGLGELGRLAVASVEEHLLFERGDREVAELLKKRHEELLQELREASREVRRLTGVHEEFAADIVKYWLKDEADWPAALRRWGFAMWSRNFNEAMAAIERYKALTSKVRELDELAQALKVSLYP